MGSKKPPNKQRKRTKFVLLFLLLSKIMYCVIYGNITEKTKR